MTMKIVVGYPPMIKEIDAKFHVKHRPVIFSWGDTIFNPMGGAIQPELIAHEEVHGQRQREVGAGVVEWWTLYIHSSKFRLDEEVAAHIAEYQYLVEHAENRKARKSALGYVARRLADPLYGRMVTRKTAMKLIDPAFRRKVERR